MFILANFYYEKIFTRRRFLNRGIVNVLPMMTIWIFLIVCSNARIPPRVNFYIEWWLIIRVISWRRRERGLIIVILIRLLTIGYIIILFSNIQYGENTTIKIIRTRNEINFLIGLSFTPIFLLFIFII